MQNRPPRRRLIAAATGALLALATGCATLSGLPGSTAAAAPPGPQPGQPVTWGGSAGCGKAPALMSGEHNIQTRGMNRNYILKVPDNYDGNRGYRLIFAFHWYGGTAAQVASGGPDGDPWAYYGLKQLSNNSAVLVAPQGIGNGWPNPGGQDVAFVDDMIGQIESNLCIDRTQLFSLGFSYGGSMTYELACERASVFRAVAVYSGGVLSGCDGGNQPIAYMGIHGIGDPVLAIGGGRAMRDRFVQLNGCQPQNAPEPPPGSRTHIVTTYSGCQQGHPLEWAAFDGGHTPGQLDGGGDSGARTWTKGEVWKFFSQFQN